MSTYPGLPDNRLIVGDIDLTSRFQLILIDGYDLDPPEPKTYTVDIPGGNGVIDLTESLTDDVVYDNRKQKFTFKLIYPEDFEKVKTQISNLLHGKAFDYKITMDPEYTYHGRFTVESYSHEAYTGGILGEIVISIDANPYKVKKHCIYKLNATGGKEYRLESGRRPVHPVIECNQPCFFGFNKEEYEIPAGTYKLNDILFKEGFNVIWLNTCKIWNVVWDEIKENGNVQKTWSDLSNKRWDEVQSLVEGASDAPRSWDDIQFKRYDDLSTTTWASLDYRRINLPDNTAYIKYDWEDL